MLLRNNGTVLSSLRRRRRQVFEVGPVQWKIVSLLIIIDHSDDRRLHNFTHLYTLTNPS